MTSSTMPRPGIDIAAEDGYAIIDPIIEDGLAPDDETMDAFGEAVYALSSWRVVWDFRRIGDIIYNDVLDAVNSVAVAECVLAPPGRADEIRKLFQRDWTPGTSLPTILPAYPKPLSTRRLDLTPFTDEWVDLRNSPDLDEQANLDTQALEGELRNDARVATELGISTDLQDAMTAIDMMLLDDRLYGASEPYVGNIADERRKILSTFLDRIATNSLFSHIAMLSEGDHIKVVPYHGHGVHKVDTGHALLTVRPGRVGASVQWARFTSALAELEELVNMPSIKEAEIEGLLRKNPLLMRGLNYTQVYHQVVLPLGDGSSLRPDIIAEPAGGGWVDILDLKLPSEPIYVGGGDRPRLSAAIAEAASQLRDYARFFEDRAAADRIEHEYGFRCYKPRQAVIIGRDPSDMNERQREASLTAYPDLRVVTYDELLRSARSLLLF